MKIEIIDNRTLAPFQQAKNQYDGLPKKLVSNYLLIKYIHILVYVNNLYFYLCNAFEILHIVIYIFAITIIYI
jgi:hypothetical protein